MLWHCENSTAKLRARPYRSGRWVYLGKTPHTVVAISKVGTQFLVNYWRESEEGDGSSIHCSQEITDKSWNEVKMKKKIGMSPTSPLEPFSSIIGIEMPWASASWATGRWDSISKAVARPHLQLPPCRVSSTLSQWDAGKLFTLAVPGTPSTLQEMSRHQLLPSLTSITRDKRTWQQCRWQFKGELLWPLKSFHNHAQFLPVGFTRFCLVFLFSLPTLLMIHVCRESVLRPNGTGAKANPYQSAA